MSLSPNTTQRMLGAVRDKNTDDALDILADALIELMTGAPASSPDDAPPSSESTPPPDDNTREPPTPGAAGGDMEPNQGGNGARRLSSRELAMCRSYGCDPADYAVMKARRDSRGTR